MAFLAVSGSCMAQAKFSHKATRLKLKSEQVKIQCRPTDARNLVAGKSGGSIFLPTQEATYVYDMDNWMEDATYTYEYDTDGRKVSQIVDDGFGQTKSEYEYNADGMETCETTSSAEEGNDFVYTNKLSHGYDKVVKDFVVNSVESVWDGGLWNMVGMGRTWKKDVSRDVKGNVEGMSTKTYFQDKFEELMKTTITYGVDGNPATWKYEELAYDGVNEPAMEEYYTLKNMVWENTDGQVLASTIDEFYTGANRLRSAEVVEPGYGTTGTIAAEYKADGSYSYLFYYTGSFEADGYSKSYVDENGSYVEESNYYVDMDADGMVTEDEKVGGMRMEVKFDGHGNVVSEALYEDGEIMDGMKYEYTYSPDYDYPTEQVYYMWNPELSQYEPFIKIVSTGFTDVTTSISEVETSRGEGATAVYNTQGVKVGTSTDVLPKGLYIVKSGGKTKKMMKR